MEEMEATHSPKVVEPTVLQSLYLDELSKKHRGRKLAIPTDDEKVREWLRSIKEPITLFGEGPYDRRERLRVILASDKSEYYQRLLDLAGVEGEQGEQVKDTDEFFVPGSDELEETRKWLVTYSLSQARKRLDRERSFRSQPLELVQKERLETYKKIGDTQLVASQVNGERPVSSCSFSPDGNLLATGDFGGICRVWSAEDCNLARELEGFHTSRIGNIVFNPDQQSKCSLASCDNDGKIGLWALDQPNTIGQLNGHSGRVAQVAFHPSGRLLGSASFDYSWRLWDVERQLELQLQEGHSRPVYSVAFHQDGALAATGGLDCISRIWDLRLGRTIWTLQGHIKSILSIDFHPLLPLVSTGSEDGTVRVWDLRKLAPVYVLPAQSSVVSCAKWNKDGLLLTAGFDGLAKVWSVDWKPIATLAGHEAKIMDAAISPSTIVTVSSDRTIKLWK